MSKANRDTEFNAVVAAAHGMLKLRGYSKSGARFRRHIAGNSVIVQFQKSAWDSSESLRFTVNFAIVSCRLTRDRGGDPTKIFDPAQGHARVRIGEFGNEPKDIWWTLDGPGSSATVVAELLPLLERGAAYCEAHVSDDALASLWRLSKKSASGAHRPNVLLGAELKTLADE